MASFSRRTISSFSLSFLDIMFCGFGAVVLLVLIINTDTLTRRSERVAGIETALQQKEMELRLTEDNIERQRSDLNSLEADISKLTQSQVSILADLDQVETATPAAAELRTIDEEIGTLQQELKVLEENRRQLAAQKTTERTAGRKVRAFVGTGNRQYLTGLKLDGERVLILIDSSASMLDRKVVDVIRRKILDDASRRSAAKWQRAVSTVEWLVANLPPTSAIQLYHFSTSATPLATDESTSWTPVTQFDKIDTMLEKLKRVSPIGGTNLETPFLKARSLIPQPDNIVLITDGLPTRGKEEPRTSTIDGAGRVKLFNKAIKNLPPQVPVNTILFPMEGDPLAASLFWKLAIDSGGSFFTPTRDWP